MFILFILREKELQFQEIYILETKKHKNAPWANMQLMTSIKETHYKWCKDNGRDTNWYKELKKDGKEKKRSSKM